MYWQWLLGLALLCWRSSWTQLEGEDLTYVSMFCQYVISIHSKRQTETDKYADGIFLNVVRQDSQRCSIQDLEVKCKDPLCTLLLKCKEDLLICFGVVTRNSSL